MTRMLHYTSILLVRLAILVFLTFIFISSIFFIAKNNFLSDMDFDIYFLFCFSMIQDFHWYQNSQRLSAKYQPRRRLGRVLHLLQIMRVHLQSMKHGFNCIQFLSMNMVKVYHMLLWVGQMLVVSGVGGQVEELQTQAPSKIDICIFRSVFKHRKIERKIPSEVRLQLKNISNLSILVWISINSFPHLVG